MSVKEKSRETEDKEKLMPSDGENSYDTDQTEDEPLKDEDEDDDSDESENDEPSDAEQLEKSIRNKLLPGEELLFIGKKTYAPAKADFMICIVAAIVIFVTMGFIQNSNNVDGTHIIVGEVALVIAIPLCIIFFLSSIITLVILSEKYNLAVTDRRVLAVRGEALISMPYESITGINEYQSGLDNMYGCGRIVITLGAKSYGFKYLKRSNEIAAFIVQQQEAFKKEAENKHISQVSKTVTAGISGNNVSPAAEEHWADIGQKKVRFCSKCGSEFEEDEVFCKYCGAKIRK